MNSYCHTGLIGLLPIKVQWHWVKGHQGKSNRKLDWWARQNEKMDSLAKDYWNQCMREQKECFPGHILHHENTAVFIEGVKLATCEKQDFHYELECPTTMKYWKTKMKIAYEAIYDINWEVITKAVKRFQPGMKRWHNKFQTGNCGVGKMEKK